MRTSKATRSPELAVLGRAPHARVLVALALLLTSACSSTPAPPVEAPVAPPPAPREVVSYDFVALDGRPISSAAMKGRITVIALLASYDVASQAEAQFLEALAHHHAPRVNVAALFLEPEDSRPLVDAFARSLSLSYPFGLANAEPVGKAFDGLYNVPSVIILDREGHDVFHHTGLLPENILDQALREVEARH